MTIYINDEEVESFNFPSGEVNVRLDENQIRYCKEQDTSGDDIRIEAIITSSDELMGLLLVFNAINKALNVKLGRPYIDLLLPYLPYSRQDRVCNKGEAFSLELMISLLFFNNFCDISSITTLDIHCDISSINTFDIHSDVTLNLDEYNSRYIHCKKIKSISLANLIKDTQVTKYIKENNTYFVSPDDGAIERVNKIAELMDYEPNCIIRGKKKRDLNTGEIRELTIERKGINLKNKNCIIFDDICDGGGTFIGLARLLKAEGANDITLCVTHGIFSKGFDKLKKYFKHIFVVNWISKEKLEDNKDFVTKLHKKIIVE